MKVTFFKSLGFALVLGFAMFSSSCDNDPCKDVACGEFGNCVEGDCVCEAGYEGANCETTASAKFVGNYAVTEDCSNSNPATYQVGVVAGSTVSSIGLVTFWGTFANPVVATVSGNDLTIANQSPDNDVFTVEGSGTYDAATQNITLTYSVFEADSVGTIIFTDVCTETVLDRI